MGGEYNMFSQPPFILTSPPVYSISSDFPDSPFPFILTLLLILELRVLRVRVSHILTSSLLAADQLKWKRYLIFLKRFLRQTDVF